MTPRGVPSAGAVARHVSRFRIAWYAGCVAAASVAFQFGLDGGVLHRLFWGW